MCTATTRAYPATVLRTSAQIPRLRLGTSDTLGKLTSIDLMLRYKLLHITEYLSFITGSNILVLR